MKSFYFLIIPIFFIVLPSCKKSEHIPNPPEDPRDQFLGSWKATDSFTESDGTIVTQTYTFSIEKSPEDDTILMRGFANLGGQGSIGVIDENEFEILVKEISINNMPGFFDASGSLLNGKLTYQYKFTSTSTNRVYNGTAVR